MVSKKKIIFILSILISCIPLFLTFNRGINYFDEGYFLEAARRIAAGELPYRDFHFVYTPAVVYFLALFLRIGGQYVIVERIVSLSISVLGVISLGLLIQKLTKNAVLVFLVTFFYALWGPAHLNFLWPVMVVLPLIFIYLYLLLESHFFLSGVVMGIILLSKHNFGATIILSFVISLLWTRYSGKRIFQVFLGFIGVLGIFLLHLLLTRSFIPFFVDMNTYTIQTILIKQSFSVPFPTQSIGKFLLYAFPGLLSLVAALIMAAQKKKGKLIFIPMTILFFYLFGIFPTPDWPHLTPLISSTGILLSLIPLIVGNRFRFFSYLFLVGMIGIGIYSLSVRNYYRWEAPLIQHTNCFSSGSMKHMCVDGKNKEIISLTLDSLKREVGTDDYIFTFYNNPIHYFIGNKKNPTSHISFDAAVGNRIENEVIGELKNKKVYIVVTRFSPGNSQAKKIGNYIEKNYLPIKTSYEFTVWKKKD